MQQNPIAKKLSDVEFQYVKLTVDDCLSRKEIAERTCRSADTIATQMKNIYRKLEINKVTELSKLYFKGLLVFVFGLIINLENISQQGALASRRSTRRNIPVESSLRLCSVRHNQRGRNILFKRNANNIATTKI